MPVTDHPLFDRFFTAVNAPTGEPYLCCPMCTWSAPLPRDETATFALQRSLATGHLDERHQPTIMCGQCGQPVTSWEYDSFTRDMQLGSGLTVQPCGHQVSKVTVEYP